MRNKKRGLSKGFMVDLKEGGLLYPVLERVKKDSTLCFEIRSNNVNIYYRGGNIMRIIESKGYAAAFNEKYCSGAILKVIKALPIMLVDSKDVQKWVKEIPSLKQAMDFWFCRKPKDEREFQQIVLRENNGTTVGSSTDYFIIDIEYDNHCGARFDLVAVEWESIGNIRKLPKNYKPKLCFIEVKYGDGALSGKAGMEKHIEDFSKYMKKGGLSTLKNEMKLIFSQKRELGLIPALKRNKNQVESFSQEVDYIFLLANHDPASNKLQNILRDLPEKYKSKDLGFGVKFCSSNFMGYGIYKQNVYSIADFIQRFKEQI